MMKDGQNFDGLRSLAIEDAVWKSIDYRPANARSYLRERIWLRGNPFEHSVNNLAQFGAKTSALHLVPIPRFA